MSSRRLGEFLREISQSKLTDTRLERLAIPPRGVVTNGRIMVLQEGFEMTRVPNDQINGDVRFASSR